MRRLSLIVMQVVILITACTQCCLAQLQIDKDLQLNGASGDRDISGAQTIDVSVGYLFNGGGTAGSFLRGDGTHFVASSIQPGDIDAGDLPTGNGNYIQNQIATAQTAGFYINGDGRAARIGIAMAPAYPLDVTGHTRLTITGAAFTTSNSGQLEVYNGSSLPSGGAAMISFHRGNVYGAHFGLDTDNWFSTQGWSAGAGYTNLRTGVLNAVGGVQYDGVNVIYNASGDVWGNFRVLQNNGAADGMYLNYGSAGGTNAHLRFYANSTTLRGLFNASTGNLELSYGLTVAGNAAITGTTTSTGRISANGGISASGSSNNFLSSTFGGQNWMPYTNGYNYYSADQHIFRPNNNGAANATISSTGLDVTLDVSCRDVNSSRDLNASRHVTVGSNLSVTTKTTIGTQGIFMPNSFDPSSLTSYIGNPGNFISFGHSGSSEDFLGFRSNNFYFRDSPSGLDVTQPTVQAQAFTAYSSKKWKTNIHTMQDALSLVQRLRGVRYNYIEGYNDGRADFGFIAEEVNEVLPEIIGYDGEGISGVDYGHVTPVLVEAMKEQQMQIDALKKQNAELQTNYHADVEKLRTELEYLKGILLNAQR